MRPFFIAGLLCLVAASATGQALKFEDTLLFKDGDKLTGELMRIDLGSAVFRTRKTADVTVDFAHVADLQCKHRFAVLKYGVPVSRATAVIGTLELKGDDLLVTTDSGKVVTMPAALVLYAVLDETFEREIARHPSFLSGWSITAAVGGSLVKGTDDGTALNTEVSVTRQVPGVSYLPVRHETAFGVRDTFEKVTRHDTLSGTSTEIESNIFHANAEQNQYVSERVYVLGLYEFDRNYDQGLQAQHLVGGGAGWTAVRNSLQRVNLKTDFHYESQGFMDPADNVRLFGQQFAVDYDQGLPRNLDFSMKLSYLPSYTRPHDYSANAYGTVSLPLFWRLRLSVTAEDNYLNNAQPGDRRNTFRVSTGLRYFN